ncbi:MAG: alpha/beta fold hydrolase [Thermoplasmata archaeon]|nr:alpha/beta fold hydrolase [Thermoplasmata archaeon]
MPPNLRPFAVDPSEYPFEDHWFPFRDGSVHFVDEGSGAPVLLLHGNPTWSYLYRDVIKELRGECRLIAPDYPGFGMSRAPAHYDFTPKEHSEVVSGLVQHLALTNVVLVVQDWGGPIGMSYAVHHRENLRGLVVMNTWAWPATIPQWLFSVVMGGWPLGYWLQTRRNYFAKSVLPSGIRHSERVTAQFRQAYTDPFPTAGSRIPTWVFPRQIRKSRSWLADIQSRLPSLSEVPAQILWGTYDDPGFPAKEMAKWQRYLKLHETETLEDASHSVPEDRPDRVAASIRRVLGRTPRSQ